MTTSRTTTIALLVLLCIPVAAVLIPLSTRSDDRLVVYCAHDAALAQGVIDAFTQQTGIQVDVRFDEEASKSLGLVRLLLAEKDAPRADVFWNNQLLSTVWLKEEGVLQPFQGTGWKRMPEHFRDPAGYWTAFAGRMRVFIVNTHKMTAEEDAVHASLVSESLSRVAIAEPLFGTTLSHYCVLADEAGMDGLKDWHNDQRARGIRTVRGNAMVKDLVAEGICDLGYTDTDDAFAAVDSGFPVSMLPVRLDGGATICLPNSVAMIAGCRNNGSARAFIDFVLSEQSELLLARGTGRQIPLGPVADGRLPDELQPLRDWAQDAVSLTGAAAYHQAVRKWLAAESAGQ